MTDLDPEWRELLQSHLDDHGFLSWLGVRVEAVEEGSLVLRVPFDDRLTNRQPRGGGSSRTVHGGVAATLVDTCGGLAVQSALPDPSNDGVATIDLDVSYLRPATSDLVATADVIRVGRTVGVASVSVESTTDEGDRAEVAVGLGSYRVFRNDD